MKRFKEILKGIFLACITALFAWFLYCQTCFFYMPMENGILIKDKLYQRTLYKSFQQANVPSLKWGYIGRYNYLKANKDCKYILIDKFNQEAFLITNLMCIRDKKNNETDPLGLF